MFYFLTLIYLIVGVFTQQSLESVTSSSSSSSSSTNTDILGLSNGPCPKIVVNHVDFDKHYGEWYEVERSANNYMGSDRCHKLMWGKPVNNVSEVINKSILKSSNIHMSITSHATLNDEGYVFTHHFPTLGDVSMQYYALDFVPDDYAIIWSCEPRGNKHIEKAWVYSRNITVPENIDALKREAFQRYNLRMPKMIRHDHSDCEEVFSSFNF